MFSLHGGPPTQQSIFLMWRTKDVFSSNTLWCLRPHGKLQCRHEEDTSINWYVDLNQSPNNIWLTKEQTYLDQGGQRWRRYRATNLQLQMMPRQSTFGTKQWNQIGCRKQFIDWRGILAIVSHKCWPLLYMRIKEEMRGVTYEWMEISKEQKLTTKSEVLMDSQMRVALMGFDTTHSG